MKCPGHKGRLAETPTSTRPTIWCRPVPSYRQTPTLRQDRSEYDGSEDVGPQDYGAEDVTSQGYGSEDKPLPRTGESVGEESAPPAQSSSDPMPDIAGQADSGL